MWRLTIAASVFAVLLGLVIIISAFARGLGITTGALLGLVLVGVGGARLAIEARRGRAE